MILTDVPPLAFSADDADDAFAEYGFNCGPAALAACLGLTPDDVRPHLGEHERRGYMNVVDMKDALRSLGRSFRDLGPDDGCPAARFPRHGIVRLQWGGSWCNPGVHPGAAASRTHWVASELAKTAGPDAVSVQWVYDINNGVSGASGWLRYNDWQDEVVPKILAAVKRSDGRFWPTHRFEVQRS